MNNDFGWVLHVFTSYMQPITMNIESSIMITLLLYEDVYRRSDNVNDLSQCERYMELFIFDYTLRTDP